jgi:enhancer of polycomb-like protein
LLVALHAANHRKEIRGKHAEPHIPTPDAAGVVEAYESLYQPGKYKEPTTHLRFSETAEETVEIGLAAGFTYFLDERDAEWIKKNNQEARGEGTSASASASTNGQLEDASVTSTRSGRMFHGRNMKGKGKEPELSCNSDTYSRTVVDEDEFELVMGLFEKLTEDKFPFIHLVRHLHTIYMYAPYMKNMHIRTWMPSRHSQIMRLYLQRLCLLRPWLLT